MNNNKTFWKRYWTDQSRKFPFNTKAHRKWGKEAYLIDGEGPVAGLCYCGTLTIDLYGSVVEAIQAQHDLCCGGRCCCSNSSSMHQIWDMTDRGYRLVNKDDFYSDAPANKQLREEFKTPAMREAERRREENDNTCPAA